MKLRSHLWIIPPILLIIAATIQPFIVKHYHLNKWKGGAFAMFSTLDHRSNRFLRCYVTTSEGEMPALLPNWEAHRTRLMYLPNTAILQREAQNLTSTEWATVLPGEADPLGSLQAPPDPKALHAIQRVYGSESDTASGVEREYPVFVVPAVQAPDSSLTTAEIESARVEAYRVIYKGNGRIEGKLLNSSDSN